MQVVFLTWNIQPEQPGYFHEYFLGFLCKRFITARIIFTSILYPQCMYVYHLHHLHIICLSSKRKNNMMKLTCQISIVQVNCMMKKTKMKRHFNAGGIHIGSVRRTRGNDGHARRGWSRRLRGPSDFCGSQTSLMLHKTTSNDAFSRNKHRAAAKQFR